MKIEMPQKYLLQAFQQLDANNDNKVSVDEFKARIEKYIQVVKKPESKIKADKNLIYGELRVQLRNTVNLPSNKDKKVAALIVKFFTNDNKVAKELKPKPNQLWEHSKFKDFQYGLKIPFLNEDPAKFADKARVEIYLQDNTNEANPASSEFIGEIYLTWKNALKTPYSWKAETDLLQDKEKRLKGSTHG